eukprot:UN1074
MGLGPAGSHAGTSISNLAIALSARAYHDHYHVRTSQRRHTRRNSWPMRRSSSADGDPPPPAASGVGYVRRSSSDWTLRTSAMGVGATSGDELPLSECFSREATIDF